MIFSSRIFLFLFLPMVLSAYFVAGPKLRNLVLLTASLFFYAWGETVFVILMLSSIIFNYGCGLLIHRAQTMQKSARWYLIAAVGLNLGLLSFFKYANFIMDNLNALIPRLGISPIAIDQIHLPIGISFFTFQAMSYVIDLYRGQVVVQKNPINIALYISLFPQLIAGPIVRYHDIARQIINRTVTKKDFEYGVKRFIIGLAKKVLIANVVGRVADHIFSLPVDTLPAGLAWIGIIAFTLQIYFDFSGYSDMAIGLGRLFGFKFLENFTFPYISRSIREFWRRWHISLSSWFRDYLYIPLGGSRMSSSRTYFNLITVFFLCGLWHGASWTFIIWGLYHGFFLIVERTGFGKIIERLPPPIKHLYTLLIVVIGWVFFRSQTLPYAVSYLQALVNFSAQPYYDSRLFLYANAEFYLSLVCGCIASMPVYHTISNYCRTVLSTTSGRTKSISKICIATCSNLFLIGIFLYSVANVMGGHHRPFLYFRF
jgi:alginate O-acetyltransferase complex protein AlgI